MNNKLVLAAALSGLITASPSQAQTESPINDVGQCHGVNSCKGSGACNGAGHECAGKNGCKGQGWKKLSKKNCYKEILKAAAEKGMKFKKV